MLLSTRSPSLATWTSASLQAVHDFKETQSARNSLVITGYAGKSVLAIHDLNSWLRRSKDSSVLGVVMAGEGLRSQYSVCYEFKWDGNLLRVKKFGR